MKGSEREGEEMERKGRESEGEGEKREGKRVDAPLLLILDTSLLLYDHFDILLINSYKAEKLLS